MISEEHPGDKCHDVCYIDPAKYPVIGAFTAPSLWPERLPAGWSKWNHMEEPDSGQRS